MLSFTSIFYRISYLQGIWCFNNSAIIICGMCFLLFNFLTNSQVQWSSIMEETHFQTMNIYYTVHPSSVILGTTADIITCIRESKAPRGSKLNFKWHKTIKNPAKARTWMLETDSGWFTQSVRYSLNFEARPTRVWTQPCHLLILGLRV